MVFFEAEARLLKEAYRYQPRFSGPAAALTGSPQKLLKDATVHAQESSSSLID